LGIDRVANGPLPTDRYEEEARYEKKKLPEDNKHLTDAR
jgi:hypothetical protein